MVQNEKINIGKEKPLLLYAPLDWGLGHTMRAIPLINECLLLGWDIIIACNSTQKKILSAEFPMVRFADLDGYGIEYGRTRTATMFKTLRQLGKILIKIKKENAWLVSFLKKNPVQAVISDNRYGFHHPDIPCVFITHQLYIHTGLGSLMSLFVQGFLYRYINRFKECWVPDFKGNGFAGILSHPVRLPAIPVHYLGALSRFRACDPVPEDELLVLLSGPEPQRTILEEKVLLELKAGKKAILVRGLPDGAFPLPDIPGVQIIDHADTATLQALICRAGYIICRSGYTSVMDLLKLKKKMVLIPTPGQPEQEYLARYLQSEGYAPAIMQQEFSIHRAEELFKTFSYRPAHENMDLYKTVVARFTRDLIS